MSFETRSQAVAGAREVYAHGRIGEHAAILAQNSLRFSRQTLATLGHAQGGAEPSVHVRHSCKRAIEDDPGYAGATGDGLEGGDVVVVHRTVVHINVHRERKQLRVVPRVVAI